jgi:hypothetical protein
MNYPFKVAEGVTNLSLGERVFRMVLGYGLIFAQVDGTGFLGWAALLPIVAIYPLMTAALGWDPIYQWITAGNKARSVVTAHSYLFSNPRGDGMIHESTAERIERAAVGTAMVIVPLVAYGPLDWQVAYPLLAVYPLMSAAIGIDLLDYVVGRTKWAAAQKVAHFPGNTAVRAPQKPRLAA